MAKRHEKERNQQQPKHTKRQGSHSGLKAASQESKDSPSSSQNYGNPDENTHDT
jgi:hypothetical protein